MEIKFLKGSIELEKDLSSLDLFVVDITKILNKLNINYVLVSGYVAILFGRNRSSEDVDFIFDRISFDLFSELWLELCKTLECVNAENADEAYKEYLLNGDSIRFSRQGEFIPNVEIKFAKTQLDSFSLKEKKAVFVNKNKLFISPLELQISFKLFLGSEKDIEDAKYIYKLFKENIQLKQLGEFNKKLGVDNLFEKYLK